MLAKILKIEGDPDALAGSAASKGSQMVYRASVEATGAAEAALMRRGTRGRFMSSRKSSVAGWRWSRRSRRAVEARRKLRGS